MGEQPGHLGGVGRHLEQVAFRIPDSLGGLSLVAGRRATGRLIGDVPALRFLGRRQAYRSGRLRAVAGDERRLGVGPRQRRSDHVQVRIHALRGPSLVGVGELELLRLPHDARAAAHLHRRQRLRRDENRHDIAFRIPASRRSGRDQVLDRRRVGHLHRRPSCLRAPVRFHADVLLLPADRFPVLVVWIDKPSTYQRFSRGLHNPALQRLGQRGRAVHKLGRHRLGFRIPALSCWGGRVLAKRHHTCLHRVPGFVDQDRLLFDR